MALNGIISIILQGLSSQEAASLENGYVQQHFLIRSYEDINIGYPKCLIHDVSGACGVCALGGFLIGFGGEQVNAE